jgi:hypothetical protein
VTIDEIFLAHLQPTLEPGEVTAAMMAERQGVGVDRAKATLIAAHKAGKLERREVRVDGRHPVWVYRPAK